MHRPSPHRFRLLLAAALLSGCAASGATIKDADRDGAALRVDLARTFVSRGAWEAAAPLLARAVIETPDNAEVRTLYATVLRERTLYPQAEREFRAALALDPRAAAAHAGLGVLYDLTRRPAEAEPAHRAAIALAPRYAPFWNNLGFSLLVVDRADEACAALEQALALDPSLAVAYNNLGFAHGRKRDYIAAERAFRAAGTEAHTRMNLSIAHARNGDATTAARLRAEAHALDPSLPLEVL